MNRIQLKRKYYELPFKLRTDINFLIQDSVHNLGKPSKHAKLRMQQRKFSFKSKALKQIKKGNFLIKEINVTLVNNKSLVHVVVTSNRLINNKYLSLVISLNDNVLVTGWWNNGRK